MGEWKGTSDEVPRELQEQRKSVDPNQQDQDLQTD
jgi:hypothetical protein